MGIIDKLTGHSSSSHSKHADQTSTSAPAFGEASTFGGQNSGTTTTSSSDTGIGNTGFGTSSTTGTTGSDAYGTDRKKGVGEKVKEAVGLDPKDNQNDPKDRAYGTTGSSTGTGSSSSYSRDATTGESMIRDSNSGLTGSHETRGIDRQSERMGNMSLNDRSTGSGTGTGSSSLGSGYNQDSYDVKTAAPVVQERIHDQYENIDKTRVEELHDRTQVKQIVQPIYDERTEAVQRDRVDHGLEVHEHGKAGLDSRTEAELAAKREALAREHRSTHDERTTERSLRPDVDVQERTNTIEEVVPVVEKDIYRPHEIEHTKRVVNIHHEAPVLAGTSVREPVSLKEWESQGHSISGTATTTRTRSGTSSSSSSSDEEGRRTGTRTTRKKGMGEKVKEAVGMDPKDHQNDPKDRAYGTTGSSGIGSSSSTTGYGQSGTSGYDNNAYGTDRKKGLGEKAKEAVGLDPKDNQNDPKDQGYTGGHATAGSSGLGSSTGSAYNTSSGSTGTDTGIGNTGFGTSSTTGTTGSDAYGTDRKKGVGEKVKEAVGMDPKDNQNDPKDRAYSGQLGNSAASNTY